MENPYQSPEASCSEAQIPSQHIKRPLLIWFTQFLLAAIAIVQLFGIFESISLIPKAMSSSMPMQDLIFSFISVLIMLGLVSALFFGLAKAKRWSWYGGIAFAAMLLIISIYVRAHPSPDSEPIAPKELAGAATAQLAMTFLLAIYPVRMYFSRSVRKFLIR